MLLAGSCDGYTNITDSWRNIGFTSQSFPGAWNDDTKLVNNWWRFTGIAGDRVITTCSVNHYGGTIYMIYIASAYPTNESMTPTTMDAYSYYGQGCTDIYIPVEVVLCPGGFYIYRPLSQSGTAMGYVTCE